MRRQIAQGIGFLLVVGLVGFLLEYTLGSR
jgi:hypothetical protein